jgi:transcriptional regulator with XRE-family HTH domain
LGIVVFHALRIADVLASTCTNITGEPNELVAPTHDRELVRSGRGGSARYFVPLERSLSVYYIEHMRDTDYGDHVRKVRERLLAGDRSYSLRQVAERVGIEPAYLSKIERGEVAPPGEDTIVRLAEELGEDKDVMLALAGKVSSDLREIIRARPKIFAELLRELKKAPNHAILRIVRQVRNGDW